MMNSRQSQFVGHSYKVGVTHVILYFLQQISSASKFVAARKHDIHQYKLYRYKQQSQEDVNKNKSNLSSKWHWNLPTNSGMWVAWTGESNWTWEESKPWDQMLLSPRATMDMRKPSFRHAQPWTGDLILRSRFHQHDKRTQKFAGENIMFQTFWIARA
jgi:hypothetical protein